MIPDFVIACGRSKGIGMLASVFEMLWDEVIETSVSG